MIRPSRYDKERTAPGFDSNERVVNGIALIVFLAALLVSGAWFYHTFLEAETAIIHSMGGK